MPKPKQRNTSELRSDPPPFIDEEERELIESFESAIERGEFQVNPEEELVEAKVRWKAIVEASRARKAISLRLPTRDVELIKSIARRRGIPYQTLIGSVLHQFANGALRETT